MYKLRQLQTMAKRKLHGLEICKCLGVIILAMPEIKLSNICKTGKMGKKQQHAWAARSCHGFLQNTLSRTTKRKSV